MLSTPSLGSTGSESSHVFDMDVTDDSAWIKRDSFKNNKIH
jgi:hypothetical protein